MNQLKETDIHTLADLLEQSRARYQDRISVKTFEHEEIKNLYLRENVPDDCKV